MNFIENKKQVITDIQAHFSKTPYNLPKYEIMAVSKTQPVNIIETALCSGHQLFGENRVQEALQKWPELQKKFPQTELHLIGPLQTNKIKDAIHLFDAIQTLDREKMALKLAEFCRETDANLRLKKIYIQVNTGKEEQKAGIFPEEMHDFISYCRYDLHLPISGLMAIPPKEDATCFHFALLAKIAKQHNLEELSMGMSADYLQALPFGATCIRLGTALFGERSIAK